MDINGKAKIWVKEFEGNNGKFKRYSMGVSKKKEDGTYVNGYFPVRFKKGVDLANGTSIDVKKGFLTLDTYTNKEGNEVKTVVAMVTDFVKEGEEEPDWDAIGGEDLPF